MKSFYTNEKKIKIKMKNACVNTKEKLLQQKERDKTKFEYFKAHSPHTSYIAYS